MLKTRFGLAVVWRPCALCNSAYQKNPEFKNVAHEYVQNRSVKNAQN